MKIRRIVTGFGVGANDGTMLAAIAALAALHDAELEALFVEGDELSRLAALPFAREVGVASGAPRRIDPESVARALRARARQAHRSLAASTGREDPRWSFRAARGSLVDALLAASPGADLLVVGNRPLDPAALRLVRAGAAALLVMPAGARIAGPLVALCAASAAPERAVPILCALADALGDGLSILCAGGNGEAAGWERGAGAVLSGLGREAAIRRLPVDDPESLQNALERGQPGVLALVDAEAVLGEPGLNALLRTARTPVFVCRA